jgi:catechol 2,3-dioxygenase-like lactoylglutathione lyase family enzyme
VAGVFVLRDAAPSPISFVGRRVAMCDEGLNLWIFIAKKGPQMDWRLELVVVPVSDVDRAKAFYTEKLGFNADHDHTVSDKIRFVQLTPPGSGCSIAVGKGLIDTAPGSLKGLQLVVDDIEVAHNQLRDRGVEVSDIQDFPWGRFIFFSDPDGNGWSVQQVPRRP